MERRVVGQPCGVKGCRSPTMYQSPVCYKHKGKSGDFTFRPTNGDEENDQETKWWEEEDSFEEDSRQVVDLAKDHSSTEDDEDWSGWWWRIPLFLIIVFIWEYMKMGGFA